jgi:hypothetical protein
VVGGWRDESIEHCLFVTLIMTATISKGTLNLRFMQNSRHAEKDLQVEPTETAATEDESHWEVAREIKDMWGINSEPSSR